MADMEWLENNAYTRHQRRSSHLALALLLAFMAAVWGWLPMHVCLLLLAGVGFVAAYRLKKNRK